MRRSAPAFSALAVQVSAVEVVNDDYGEVFDDEASYGLRAEASALNEFIDGLELASGLGADVAEGRRIIAYLEEKGLLKVDDHKAGIIRITADGVDAVETE